MRSIIFISLTFLIICSCSSERVKIFNEINSSKNNYSLYFIKIGDNSLASSNPKYEFPFYIDNQSVIHEIGNEWNLKIRDIPVEKNILYKVLLFDSDKILQKIWIDSKFKTAIWEDELLFFSDTLLTKYKNNFKNLFKAKIKFEDAINARNFQTNLSRMKIPFYLSVGGHKYWFKYDGKYKLRRLSEDIKPDKRVGKLRSKIKKDFQHSGFELIRYSFNESNDSLYVEISSDSSFVDFIPEKYSIIDKYAKYRDIELEVYCHNADSIQKISQFN